MERTDIKKKVEMIAGKSGKELKQTNYHENVLSLQKSRKDGT